MKELFPFLFVVVESDIMSVTSFRDLIVWQKADELFFMVVDDASRFPKITVAIVIKTQLIRAVGSISSNIAEGWSARHGKEFLQGLMVARKEAGETLNWLLKTYQLGYISEERLAVYETNLDEIRKMINSLAAKIRRNG